MPPASRNHRVPTAGDTPALTAASSLECPVAIAAQNRRCFSCRRTEGRPGERSFARPARSERLLRSEEHTSELQSRLHLVCRLLLEKKKQHTAARTPPPSVQQ